MTANAGVGLCRVTVIAPNSRVDVALPVDVPIAEMLPTLLRHAGADMADAGLVHGGWSLQRLGETPLDSSQNATALALRDGEMLYLRPRQAQLPELAFDDVIDAIATASQNRAGRWQESTTRRTGFASAALAIGLTTVVLATSGPPWIPPALVAAVLAAALVTSAFVLSRAVGDSAAGAFCGYAALPVAFVAGAASFAGQRTLGGFGALQLVTGAGVVAVVAMLAAVVVSDRVPAFAGAAIAALIITVAALVQLLTGLSAPGTAAVTAASVLAVAPLVPMFAFRLADLPLPEVPTSAEDLRKDTGAVAGAEVLRKTAYADRFVTGMVGASAVVLAGCEWLLARQPTGAAPWLVAIVAAATALRARLFFGRAQRLWLLGSAAFGWVFLTLGLAAGHGQLMRLVVVVLPLAAAAALFITVALRVPGRRLSPFWGRATDVVEALLVVTVLPLALAVLGVYGYVRGLTG